MPAAVLTCAVATHSRKREYCAGKSRGAGRSRGSSLRHHAQRAGAAEADAARAGAGQQQQQWRRIPPRPRPAGEQSPGVQQVACRHRYCSGSDIYGTYTNFLPCCDCQELAWGSYALLRNTTVTGLLVWHDGNLLAARGSLGIVITFGDTQQALSEMGDVSPCWPWNLMCKSILHGMHHTDNCTQQ
jgi:Cofactor assembly of complex C subunit B, CCB2/CCB4